MKRYLTFTLIFLLGPFLPISVAQGQDEDVLLAWGNNHNGQLNVPEPLSGYTLIDGGQQYSLGLRDDGTVEAWGSNSSGQLGIPEPNSGWTDIGAGDLHCLGLKADGSIVPWGWTQVKEPPEKPGRFIVAVSPNPFNATTEIKFSLNQPQQVDLMIYDVTGRKVATLVNHTLQAGPQVVTWRGLDDQGRAVSSGVYLVRLLIDDGQWTSKMVLLK